MATITKTTTKKDKATGETVKVTKTYTIDASFKPEKIDEICAEFIENYCEANNQIEWLLEKVNTTITTKRKAKDGTEKTVKVDYPFVSLRADFANKFFPEIVVGAKKTKESLKDRLNKKYAK